MGVVIQAWFTACLYIKSLVVSAPGWRGYACFALGRGLRKTAVSMKTSETASLLSIS
jgi:hypothetical protein